MKALVIGASGYVGSRLVPRLLRAGYDVHAGFTRPASAGRYWWHDQVTAVALDVRDPRQTAAAIADMDVVYYLVHSLARSDFAKVDRQCATHVADALAASTATRAVYLSGIVPKVAHSELSHHLRSRLEVERILASSPASTLTLRASLLVGAGSTSLEIVRQISERLPVHTVPTWLRAHVQPIATADILTALVTAAEFESPTRHFDLGGPTVLPYPELLRLFEQAPGSSAGSVTHRQHGGGVAHGRSRGHGPSSAGEPSA